MLPDFRHHFSPHHRGFGGIDGGVIAIAQTGKKVVGVGRRGWVRQRLHPAQIRSLVDADDEFTDARLILGIPSGRHRSC